MQRASCAAGLFFAGSLFITGYYLPIYFQAVRGASPLMSGVDVLPNILPQMFMSVVAGKLGKSRPCYIGLDNRLAQFFEPEMWLLTIQTQSNDGDTTFH